MVPICLSAEKAKTLINLTETNAATDTVRIAKGDSLVGGFDVVNGFKLGEDKLDLATNKIAANAAVVDGTDSGGIGSHLINNGLISFDDINNLCHCYHRQHCQCVRLLAG